MYVSATQVLFSEGNTNVVATATISNELPEQTVDFRSCTGSREPIDALWGQQVPIVASDLFTETLFEAERLASINIPEPAVQLSNRSGTVVGRYLHRYT